MEIRYTTPEEGYEFEFYKSLSFYLKVQIIFQQFILTARQPPRTLPLLPSSETDEDGVPYS